MAGNDVAHAFRLVWFG